MVKIPVVKGGTRWSKGSKTPVTSQRINTRCLFLAHTKSTAGQKTLYGHCHPHVTQRPRLLGSYGSDGLIHGLHLLQTGKQRR